MCNAEYIKSSFQMVRALQGFFKFNCIPGSWACWSPTVSGFQLGVPPFLCFPLKYPLPFLQPKITQQKEPDEVCVGGEKVLEKDPQLPLSFFLWA